MGRLTDKQRKWAEAFAGEAKGNATRAAQIAGYSGDENALSSRGAENARNRKIRAYLRELVQDDPLVASGRELRAFWTALLRGDEPANMGERIKASELLGKASGELGPKGTDDDPTVTRVVVEYADGPPPGGNHGD